MNRNIPTRAVKAVITDEHDRILFLHRNVTPGAVDSWDLPGGLVEEGESDEEALGREVLEELGVRAIVLHQSGTWSFYRPLDGKTVSATNYKVELQSGDITLSEEHTEHKYVSNEELGVLIVKDPSLITALLQ